MTLSDEKREKVSLLVMSVVALAAIAAVVAILGPTINFEGSMTGNVIASSTTASSLYASPNPCELENGICSTLIAWQHKGYGQVWLVLDGKERFFACDEDGGGEFAEWIDSRRFEFRLYDATSCEKEDRGEFVEQVMITGYN